MTGGGAKFYKIIKHKKCGRFLSKPFIAIKISPSESHNVCVFNVKVVLKQ